MEYQVDGAGRISALLQTVLDTPVTACAENIRRERTGVHAKTDIWLGDKWLGGTFGNVERDEERLRFVNSTLRKLKSNEALFAALSAGSLKHHYDEFCLGLWDQHIGQIVPAWVPGAAERKGLSFLAKPYLLQKGGTIFFGAPKSGKSYFEYIQAISVDAGISLFWPVLRARVIVVNLERDEETVRQRIGNVNVALGLPRERPLLMLNRRGGRLTDLDEALRYYVKEMGVEHVGLDSLSRAGAGSMVEDQVANRTMDTLNRVCPSWSAIGHTSRAGGDEHVFGSQMYDCAADMLVRVTSQQDGPDKPLGVGLQVTGANDTGRSGMEIMALDFDALGLVGIRRAKSGEFPQIEQGQLARMSLSTQLAGILKHGPLSVEELAEATGTTEHLCRNDLNRHKDRFVLVAKEGKKSLWGLAVMESAS